MLPIDHAWTPTAYGFNQMNPRYAIKIEMRGNDTWAIVDGGACLARDGAWEPEGLPSGRSQEFLDRCRYSLSEAQSVAEKWIAEHPAEVRRIERLPPIAIP